MFPKFRANPTTRALIAVIALCTGSIMAQGTQLVAIPLSSNADINFPVGSSPLGFVAPITFVTAAVTPTSGLAFSASTHGSGSSSRSSASAGNPLGVNINFDNPTASPIPSASATSAPSGNTNLENPNPSASPSVSATSAPGGGTDSKGIPEGAKIGIGVGVAAGVMLCAAILFLIYLHHKRSRPKDRAEKQLPYHGDEGTHEAEPQTAMAGKSAGLSQIHDLSVIRDS